MHTPRSSRPHRHDSRTGSPHGLLALINDVRQALDTASSPVAAVPGAGRTGLGAASPLIMHATVETSQSGPQPSRLRSRASRALHPPPGDRPVPDAAPQSTVADVDDDHAEVWGLVKLAQDGDGDAFGLLYDRYVDSVFRFIYYRVNDRALAEDFTSETFVRALRRIGTISYQGRDIGAWFVTIARNIVLDHVKSARNRLEVTTADTVETREAAESTESAVLTSLDAERLRAAVEQLGDEQRECVMLRFMQGLSVSETASVMGKNDGAVKALQHRAVRKLADIVGDDLR